MGEMEISVVVSAIETKLRSKGKIQHQKLKIERKKERKGKKETDLAWAYMAKAELKWASPLWRCGVGGKKMNMLGM